MPREGTRTGAVGTAAGMRVQRLRASLRVAHALVLVLLGLIIGLNGVDGSRESQVAHVVLGLGQAVIGLDVFVRGPRGGQVAAGGALLALAATPAFSPLADSSDGVAAACVTLCAVRALTGWQCGGALVGLLATFIAVRAGFGHADVLESVRRAVPGSVDSWVGGALARYLERGADQAEAAARAADREELAVAAHDAGIEAVRRTQRVLHDEVLVALTAIAASGVPSSSGRRTEPSARALAVDALRSIAELDRQSPDSASDDRGSADRTTSLEALVAAVLRSAPLEVTLRMEVDGTQPALSADAAAAAERALGEALRNVSTHTRCDSASMVVSSRDGDIEIVLSDRGPGIDSPRASGFGIDGSIRRPIEAVGGTAAIDVTGRGTEVRLRLPTEGGRSRPQAIRTAREQAEAAGGPIGAVIVPVTIPVLTVQAVMNVKFSLELQHSEWWLLTTVALLVIGSTHSAIVARRPLSDGAEALFVLSLLGITGLMVAFAPTAGVFSAKSIIWGSIGVFLFLWLFFMPLAWALASLACAAGLLAIAWASAPADTPAPYLIGAINGAVLIPSFSAILGVLVRRDGRAVIAERARRLSRLSELELRRQLSRAVSLHLDHTRRVIVPWLAKVAGGELDPADPAVRAHARVLEREARDDLHAAGFFDDRLREDVSRYRAGGGTVEIRPGLRPGSHARVTGALLGSLVTTLPPRHRITVSPTPQDPERARVAVVPPPPAPLPAALPRGARLLEHDQDRLVLTVAEWTEPVVA